MEWRDDVFITNLAKFSTKAPSKEKETQIFVLHLSSPRVSALKALPACDGPELIRNLINSRMITFGREHSTGIVFVTCSYSVVIINIYSSAMSRMFCKMLRRPQSEEKIKQ